MVTVQDEVDGARIESASEIAGYHRCSSVRPVACRLFGDEAQTLTAGEPKALGAYV